MGARREWEGVIRAPYKELLPLLGNLLHYDYAKRAQSKESEAGGERLTNVIIVIAIVAGEDERGGSAGEVCAT